MDVRETIGEGEEEEDGDSPSSEAHRGKLLVPNHICLQQSPASFISGCMLCTHQSA